jgi:hypothetical protein
MIKNTLMILYINSVILLLLSVTLVSKDAWGVSDSFWEALGQGMQLGGKLLDLVPTPDSPTSSPPYSPPDPGFNNPSNDNFQSTYIKQQWKQFWTQFENQLVVLSPYEQEMALSNVRMVLYSLLSSYSPDQQQEAISELSEIMSP